MIQVSTKVFAIEHTRTIFRRPFAATPPFSEVLAQAAIEMQRLIDVVNTYNPNDFENGITYALGFALGDPSTVNDTIEPKLPSQMSQGSGSLGDGSILDANGLLNPAFRFRSKLFCFTDSQAIFGAARSIITVRKVFIGDWPEPVCRFAGSTDGSGVDTIEECGQVPTATEVPIPMPFEIPSNPNGGISVTKFVELFPSARQVDPSFLAPPCCAF